MLRVAGSSIFRPFNQSLPVDPGGGSSVSSATGAEETKAGQLSQKQETDLMISSFQSVNYLRLNDMLLVIDA